MSAPELEVFLAREFPQINEGGEAYTVAEVGPAFATLRLRAGERHLRPGGTVSGPTLFALADLAAYVAILAHIGPVALAVTTNLSINFLRKPEPGPLAGKATILKLGKRLAVTEIAIASESADPDDPEAVVAHAVATYSIPPR